MTNINQEGLYFISEFLIGATFNSFKCCQIIGCQGALHRHGPVQGPEAAFHTRAEALRRRGHNERRGFPQRAAASLGAGPELLRPVRYGSEEREVKLRFLPYSLKACILFSRV